MKLHYYPETDSLYIDLSERPGIDSKEIADGVVMDLDANGRITGLDIQHASRNLALNTLETIALPTANAAEAS